LAGRDLRQRIGDVFEVVENVIRGTRNVLKEKLYVISLLGR
jgi:hypothetical protein